MNHLKILLLLALSVLNHKRAAGNDVVRFFNSYFYSLSSVKSIAFDNQGNTWMSHGNAGIAGFNDTFFTYLNQLNSNLPGMVATVVIGNDNRFWVGSKGYGLFVVNGLSITNYTTANSSLSGDFIESIALGPNNTVWVGTGNGISEFDGTNWTTYNKSNSGLPDNSVTKLIYHDSSLWIGTNIGGLAKLRKGTWTVYDKSNSGIVDNTVTDIDIDASNNVWVSSIKGLSMFNGTWKTFTTSNSTIPSNFIRAIAIDQNGKKWIGTLGSLAVYNDTNWVNYDGSNSGLKNGDVFAVEVGKDNRIWIGSSTGLQSFDRVNWKFFDKLNSGIGGDENHKVLTDSNNIVWFASNNGVIRYDGLRWINYTTKNAPFISDYISAINNDRNGNIWAASGNGLFKFDGNSWTKVDPFNGANPSFGIDCITVGKGDTLWLGTRGGGVVCFASGSGTLYNTGNSGLTNNTIHDILIDSKGKVWIAHSLGLNSFDGQNFFNYTTANSGFPSPGTGVLDLCSDHTGKLWIGTLSSGLISFDGTNWNMFNDTNSKIDHNSIFGIGVDKSNNVWIATAMHDGFFIYDGSTFKRVAVPNNRIIHINIDRNDVKWLNTLSNGTIIYGQCVLEDVIKNNNTLTAKMDGAFYQWIDCNTGTPIPNQTSRSFTPTQNGNYAVIITFGYCSDTSACTAITGITGIKTLSKAMPRIAPNPVSSSLNIKFSENFDGTAEILDLNGRILITQKIENSVHVEIPVESLQGGLYLIRLENRVLKFLKE